MAALIDLGIDPGLVRRELSKLGLDHEFDLNISRGAKSGICGTRVEVHLKNDHHHHHQGHHRNLRDIEKLFDESGLSVEIKNTAKEIFLTVALAEAKVHGKDLESVHFHEVGATDSIVDIAGAAICFQALEIDRIIARPVELGGGFVTCAHGVMPVPAPATAEIVKDIPTTLGAVSSEATTPTGAAILKTLVDEFRSDPEFTIRKTGYGIGHRDTEIPNVLRVYLADDDH